MIGGNSLLIEPPEWPYQSQRGPLMFRHWCSKAGRVFSMGAVSSHASSAIKTEQVNYPRERTSMVKDALEQWLNGLELQLDQKILARICLALADDFDTKANTSTAAELRKTYLELKRSLGDQGAHDPLEAILKR